MWDFNDRLPDLCFIADDFLDPASNKVRRSSLYLTNSVSEFLSNMLCCDTNSKTVKTFSN